MKKKLILFALLSSGVTIFAAFSMRDPATLHLMSPKPATTGLPTGGLLAEYVADTAYFNADWADAGVTTWNAKQGSHAAPLNQDMSFGSPSFSPSGYDGKACVLFSDSLLQAGFAYTGQQITWIYVGDFRPDFNTSPDHGGYPRLAGLANYGLSHEDYTSPDCGIFLYAPDGVTWDSLRAPDVFSHGGWSNPDTTFYKVIMVLKQDGSGLWTQTTYFPDGTSVNHTHAGTLSNYNTDTLNLGGNAEPNLGIFNICELALYDHALSTADEAAAVAYLKTTYW